ncbi:hypothetical protein IHE55_18025 [Streptomyces pactum]|uniref:WXG100 family type VII secretion target n=1 Tax=Streptomyces pactum TaxID=68249 RepID=A0ABS0NMZ0_9ACTN|nr:hypothetical protein [Streptomyces pactum]MBH5336570.1 hypothetical protein [Streptomyces pactum]
MKYQDVMGAPLGKLKTAADAWATLARSLETLATEARDGMQAKAERAVWKGVNSTVTREFIGQTAREFADAAKTAKGMHELLSDAHATFKLAKDNLVRLRDVEAPEAQVRIDETGKVSALPLLTDDDTAKHDPDYAKVQKTRQDNAAEFQRWIDKIVDDCGDADESFKLALEANAKDAHDFTAPAYSSLDQEEAARASRLLARGADISNTDLTQLNELLLDNNHRPTFSLAFYDRLGPEKVLTFYGQLAAESSRHGQYDKKFLKGVQSLQRGLGLNLATASRDSRFSEEWGPALRKLGGERIAVANDGTTPPYGYQIFGGILRYGNYSKEFLTPIAEHVTQLRAHDPSAFDPSSQGETYKDAFNPSGKNGAGYDPVTAVLEALGHSPEASKEFFHGEPTLYNRDGSEVKDPSKGSDLDVNFTGENSYLQYFTGEGYESFPDTDRTNTDLVKKSDQYMPEALGHALESATLGKPWDGSGPAVRDEKTVEIMDKVLDVYGDSELLKQHKALSDSLGRMGAAYIDDINWAMDKRSPGSAFFPQGDPRLHLGSDVDAARDFLSAVGQHPNAYAAISSAEQLHVMSHLDGPFDVNSDQNKGNALNVVRVGAEVQGVLDQSRASQIEAEGAKKYEDYAKAEGDEAAWRKFNTSAVITGAAGGLVMTGNPVAGGAVMMVPIAVEYGSGLISEYLGMSLGEASEKDIEAEKKKIEEESDQKSEQVYRGGERRITLPVQNFIESNGIDGTFEEEIHMAQYVGYTRGNELVGQQGEAPQVD